MAYTRLNPPVKMTTVTTNNVTINGGTNYYANLGSYAAVQGYEPIGVLFDLSDMSSFNNLVAGALQTNGEYIWSRFYNSQSAASTGSWSAKVFWAKING